MKKEFDYIIVGAGLSGLALAKELCKKGKKILVLEKGNYITILGNIFFAALFYDKFALAKSIQGILIYRAFGVGGTSIVSCGNAVEPSDEEIDRIGIDIKDDLNGAKNECLVTSNDIPIGRASRRIMDAANKLGYSMQAMPKFGMINNCRSCGKCTLGCVYQAKWTANEFIKDLDKSKVDIIPNISIKKILIKNGKTLGVEGNIRGIKKKNFYGDRIILCAGGLGTPVILQNSGIKAGKNLFVDLFNVTYGTVKNANQNKEMSMSCVSDKFHKDKGFILSPFMDNWIGFLSIVSPENMSHAVRLSDLMGIMTKIADDNTGEVHKDGRVSKEPTQNDFNKLKTGSDIAKEILKACGARDIFATRARGAHPGGTAAIGKVVDRNLETKIKNIYVCDASVLPFALGLPPMLTLIALSKWFAKNII